MTDELMSDEEFLTEIKHFQYWGINKKGLETVRKAEHGTSEQKYLWALIFYKRCLTFEGSNDSEIYGYFKQAANAGHEKSALYLNVLSNGSVSGDILNLYNEGNRIYKYSESAKGPIILDHTELKTEELKNGALACWRKSAKGVMELARKGISPAQIQLAEMYLNGKGVPRSIIHAYAWAEIAKINGQPKSSEIQDNIMKNAFSTSFSRSFIEGITDEGIMRAEMKAADMLEANPELYEDVA